MDETARAVAILSGSAGVFTGLVLAAVGRWVTSPLRRTRQAPHERGETPVDVTAHRDPETPRRPDGLTTDERVTPGVPPREGRPQVIRAEEAVTMRRQEPPLTIRPETLVIRPQRSRAPAQPVQKIRPAPRTNGGRQRSAATRTTPMQIVPRDITVWEMQGWTRVRGQLNGHYKAPQGSVAGYIRQPDSPRPQFFIQNPPQALRRHDHWCCFHPAGAGVYSIHFSPAPQHPDQGILAVERVLNEALGGTRRRHG